MYSMDKFGKALCLEHQKVDKKYEKTGEVVRVIRFHTPNEFNEFLKGFKAMGYPGYGWRYKDKEKKKEKHE